MLNGILAAIDVGLMYAFLALGVFLTFRILNFADLTVDATFTAGAGSCAICIRAGYSPVVAIAVGVLAGALGGLITALLHTKCKIDPLLSSILTMMGLYSVNLKIMGSGNLPLLNQADPYPTVFDPLRNHVPSLVGSWVSVTVLALAVLAVKFGVDWFLSTNFGLAVMATGDNPGMATSFGVNTDRTKIVALMVANGLAGLSGALIAQYQRFADVNGGTGLILAGLASVILGNALLGTRFMILATLGEAVGSVLYRVVIFFALKAPFVSAQDMKLVSALLAILVLVVSQSKNLRGAFSRLSPWRPKPDDPEPMTVVPNTFSPLATADRVSAGPENRPVMADEYPRKKREGDK